MTFLPVHVWRFVSKKNIDNSQRNRHYDVAVEFYRSLFEIEHRLD
jgi:hypothetical protein